MTNREVVTAFLDRFCAGDTDSLASILAEDLKVTGPLLRCGSRAAYLESLRANPPESASYRVRSMTDGDNSVAVFYDYEKRGGTVLIAQLFRFNGELIAEMCVVFDARRID